MATNKKVVKNVNFPFSHYKLMKTLSCHSNENTRPTAIKHTIFIEANLTNILQSFSFIPLMASEEMILDFLCVEIYPFCYHGNHSYSEVWTTIICLAEDKSMATLSDWNKNTVIRSPAL